MLQVTTLPQTPESAGERMKFGQLSLSSIVEIGATKCQAEMHQNRFRLGLRPRPPWGAYSVPPDPLAGFMGPSL